MKNALGLARKREKRVTLDNSEMYLYISRKYIYRYLILKYVLYTLWKKYLG